MANEGSNAGIQLGATEGSNGVNMNDVQMEDEHQETAEGSETIISKKKRKKSTLRSPHWKDFLPIYVFEGDPPTEVRKAKCKRCGFLVAANSSYHGTNGLKNHTETCVKKHLELQTQPGLSFQTSSTGDGGAYIPWRFDQVDTRLAFAEMLMMDDEPFKYVERAGFKHFMSRACPMFVFPCRKTVKTDCVKLFLEMKESLKTFFKSKGMGRVSITTDCWTSLRNINYIAITAHFISRNWQLHKRIICFRKITSHKGEDIANSVMMCLDEWDLKTVLCCTVDNASANDVVVRHMRERFALWGTNILDGKFLHMRCVAHIINLVVSDGLEEIGMSVRRIREAVKWITASSSREEVWKRCTNSMVIECKKALTLDVPTRWNSTYLMLESVEPYASAFRPYEGMLPAFKADLDKMMHGGVAIGTPTDEDWVNVRWMMEYLKKFYDLTCLVSGTSYVTSHLFFKEMCDLFDLISEVEQSEDPKISSMARKMRMKVAKYWAEDEVANPRMNRIIYLAAALDPRQKLKHVQKCLSKVYGSRRAIEIVGEVKDLFAELFESYKTMLLPPRAPRTSVSQSSATSSQNNRRPSVNTDIRRLSTRGRCSAIHDSDDEEDMVDSSELTLYFTEAQYREKDQEDNSVVDSFDILKWWATHGVRFPVLAEIARDMLAIPISTVASESAFSTGGRVLNSFRTSLIPGIVEALICCGDWLRMSSIHSVSMNDEEDVPVEDLETEYEEVLRTFASSNYVIGGEHVPSGDGSVSAPSL